MISTDQGASWSAPHLILSTQEAGWTLHSAVDDAGAFYGSWSYAGEVHVFRTADGGLTWSDTIVGEGGENAVAVDGDGVVHVLFATYTGGDTRSLMYRTGDDGGAIWSDPVEVGTSSADSGFNPSAWCSIAADRNSRNVLVAWQDGSSGNFEVYARRSPNGGKTWQRASNLSETLVPSLQPELFFDHDSDAHIVWNDDFMMYYRRGPFRGR